MSATPGEPKRRALGKGLESLLPAKPAPIAAVAASAGPSGEAEGRPLEIDVSAIERNPFQTRTQFDEAKLDELTASVAATGVVQPIVVRPLGGGRYQLIAGERRWLASQRAGKATVPAIVREAADAQAMEMTIVENLQRSDLNPMEQARAFQRLSRDFHLTQEQMAVRTGKDRASVANFLRLLRLPEGVQGSVERGELSFGHARALLALEEPALIQAAAGKVLALHLSVRGTESLVHGLLHPEQKVKPTTADRPAQDPNVRDAQDSLRRALGLKVLIEDRKGRGRVIIEYSGVDDFDAILSALGKQPETEA